MDGTGAGESFGDERTDAAAKGGGGATGILDGTLGNTCAGDGFGSMLAGAPDTGSVSLLSEPEPPKTSFNVLLTCAVFSEILFLTVFCE